ncbi:hypothetical protein BASA81_014003 [Batrachochytrium salamandrivorans]|nr:hypothetical protein BASA81_014003 [Batrachochytrium salamandrivorans]
MFAKFARRTLATASSSAAPPKRESTFVKIWIKRSVAAWPIIGICGVVVVFCGSFIVHVLRGPEIHFNKHERKTIDYLENQRELSSMDAWKESKFHTGPNFAHPTKRAFDREN